MSDDLKITQVLGQVEYAPPPEIRVSQVLGQVEYAPPPEVKVSQALGQVEYFPAPAFVTGFCPIYTGRLAGVVLDAPVPMADGQSYAVRFRLADNTALLATVVTEPGEEISQLTFGEPLSPPPLPAAGDLFLFGESGKEAIDLIIKSIQPNNQLGAKLIAAAYDEDIYKADLGPIPPYDPGITIPPEWWTPIIDWIRSGGDVLWRSQDGSWESQILVSLFRPSGLAAEITGVEGQYWRSDNPGVVWMLGPRPFTGEFAFRPVEDGVNYGLQLRYVRLNGSRGPWTAVQSVTVAGKTAPPANVTGFQVFQVQGIINFTWSRNPDLDIWGYEIRYGPVGVAWEAAAVITEVMMGTSFATPILNPGTWDFLIKAIDTGGNYSVAEARRTLQVIPFYTTLSDRQQWPLWPGTRLNLVRDPASGWLLPEDQDIPSGNEFFVFDNFVVNPYAEMSYEAPEIDLGADMGCLAWDREDTAEPPPGYQAPRCGEAYCGELICGGPVYDFQPHFYLDYRLAAGAYGGYQPWTIGALTARDLKFKLAAAGPLVFKAWQLEVAKTV